MAKRVKFPERGAWKRENAFETFLLMGPDRSLPKLAAQTNLHVSTLQKWSGQFQWQKRVEDYDAKAIKVMAKDTEEKYIEGIKKKHQELYQELQAKGMKLIRKKNRVSKFDTVKDLTVAVDIAIKGERATLGLNDSKLKMGVVKDGYMAMVEAVMRGDNAS